MLVMANIAKSYALGSVQVEVLKGVDLNVAAGDFLSIMGPSGSGRSTLMNILGLLGRRTGGTCRLNEREVSTMVELLEKDANVRVVWKEFPILGPVSEFAARASMAAERQGKYHDFHIRLMGEKGKLSVERVMEVAGLVGLDVAQLSRDMKDPIIQDYIEETRSLAQAIGIRGTPSFVIDGALVRGVVESARMKQLVAAARADG